MGKCVCGTNQEQADSAFDLSPLGALRCWRLRCGMFQPSRRFLYSRAGWPAASPRSCRGRLGLAADLR